MTYDQNNIFAKILREEIPCNKVYEDMYALAFHDISPQAKLHVLVIPKGEYIDFADFIGKADAETVQGFFGAVAHVADELGASSDGYRILSNKGHNGGQEVPHFHIHLFAGEKLGRMIG